MHEGCTVVRQNLVYITMYSSIMFHIGGRWASVGGLLPHTKKDCKGGDTKLTISYDVVLRTVFIVH